MKSTEIRPMDRAMGVQLARIGPSLHRSPTGPRPSHRMRRPRTPTRQR